MGNGRGRKGVKGLRREEGEGWRGKSHNNNYVLMGKSHKLRKLNTTLPHVHVYIYSLVGPGLRDLTLQEYNLLHPCNISA